ncbi:hypothetical protein, partial [Acinetobacter sp. YZS-X1-1]|uniref:hypothetical protein n=1 Tax=Acinetobacter sp. YZS-X1-1 TaxID=1501691 RepID=UPI00054CB9DF
ALPTELLENLQAIIERFKKGSRHFYKKAEKTESSVLKIIKNDCSSKCYVYVTHIKGRGVA